MAEIITFEKKFEVPSIKDAPIQITPKRVDGRTLSRKSVEDDKVRNISSLEDNSITNAMMQDDTVKQAELDIEDASLSFGSGDTSDTATVTTNSIVIGWYVSNFANNPVASHLKLSISGTILTGTLSAAPGGTATLNITVKLLKI